MGQTAKIKIQKRNPERFRSNPGKKSLVEIRQKVLQGERLSREDGITLYNCSDLVGIGHLANLVRERLHGDKTYFNQNFHMNATNVCEANCLFCSFARIQPGDEQAFTFSLEQSKKFIEARYHPEVTEIHIVNGLHQGLAFDYYTSLLEMIRENFPNLHIKAFTAVEIQYFSEKYNMSIEEVLTRLMKAGLMSMPGGGAEILGNRVRKKICADKVSGEDWLKIHDIAHKLGLKTNATMLYGHVENYEERVDHLLALREQQDKSKGFQVFIPLAFHPEGNRMKNLPGPSAFDSLRTYAISRLLLDNFPHIKAYWAMLGVHLAQLALSFGANDVDGTVVSEKIYRMAGNKGPEMLTKEQLIQLIEETGRKAIERDTVYNTIGEE